MLILLAIVIPFFAAILILLVGEKNNRLRNAIIMATCLIDFGLVLWIAGPDLSGRVSPFTLLKNPLFPLQFQVDSFSLFFALLASFLWIFTELFSFGYMRGEHSQTRYFTCLTLCLGTTLGIAFAANLITLYLFYELLTIGVYPLVIHEESREAFRAGVMYLIYLLSGGILVLFGIILTYKLTGGDLVFIHGGIPGLVNQNRTVLYLLFALFIIGFGVKSTIMPLHGWLPRAMIAPTPISALLHAVAVVKAGLFGVIRIIYCVFGAELFRQLNLNYILGIWAGITILGAAIIALRQPRIKGMLAYSTINQLSFVILGAASCHPLGLLGALLHFMYHSVMKITLFYSAGSIIKQTGRTTISQMCGLAKRLPITSAAFALGAIGIVGIPPAAGWVSKVYLLKGYLEIRQTFFASVFIISSFLELGFLFRPVVNAYFRKGEDFNPTNKVGREAPLSMLIPIVVVAILAIAFGILGGPAYQLSSKTVAEFFSLRR